MSSCHSTSSFGNSLWMHSSLPIAMRSAPPLPTASSGFFYILLARFFKFKTKPKILLFGKNIFLPGQGNRIQGSRCISQIFESPRDRFESSYRPRGLSYAHWRDISRRTRTTNPGVNIALQCTARLHVTFFDFFRDRKKCLEA